MSELTGRTTVVVGASRGLGRGIARAFAEASAPVARSPLHHYEAEVLILVAGANPLMRPLHYQRWETFSANWHTYTSRSEQLLAAL